VRHDLTRQPADHRRLHLGDQRVNASESNACSPAAECLRRTRRATCGERPILLAKTVDDRLTPEQEDLLALRVAKKSMTLIGGIVAPLIAVAAVFGFHISGEIREKREALEAQIASAQEEIRRDVSEAHRLRDSLGLLVAEATLHNATQGKFFEATATAYQTQMGTQLEQSSRILGRMVDRTASTDAALLAMRDSLRAMEQVRQEVRARLVNADTLLPALRQNLADVRHHLDSLESRVLGSGTVVVKERDPLEVHGMDLILRYEKLANETDLIGFAVRDARTHDALVEPRYLRIGQSLEFRSRRSQYRVTPRYRVSSRLFGRKMVGLHIEQFALPPSATAGTPER
jgi:hypothetical protein